MISFRLPFFIHWFILPLDCFICLSSSLSLRINKLCWCVDQMENGKKSKFDRAITKNKKNTVSRAYVHTRNTDTDRATDESMVARKPTIPIESIIDKSSNSMRMKTYVKNVFLPLNVSDVWGIVCDSRSVVQQGTH